MDYQVLFNGAIVVAAFFGCWVLNNITKTLDRLDNDLRQLPLNYVAKLDYHQSLQEIKAMLGNISDKLDRKVDKS